MDKVLFRFFMGRKNDDIESLASALAIHKSSLYAKLNGKIAFSVAEINIIKKRWCLSPDEVSKIFLG